MIAAVLGLELLHEEAPVMCEVLRPLVLACITWAAAMEIGRFWPRSSALT